MKTIQKCSLNSHTECSRGALQQMCCCAWQNLEQELILNAWLVQVKEGQEETSLWFEGDASRTTFREKVYKRVYN